MHFAHLAEEVVVIGEGAHSDYFVEGVFVKLDSRPFQKMLDEYLEEFPGQRAQHEGRTHEFVEWMMARRYLREIAITTLHLGSHGTFELSSV